MKITINDFDYQFRQTLRSMMMFEEVTKKAFTISTLTDVIVYSYCILLANNEVFTMTFDEFTNYLDEHPTTQMQMTNAILESANDEAKKK